VTDRWREYVEGSLDKAGGRLAAAFEDWAYMQPVLTRIRRRFPRGARVLELGCGAGLHTSLLASWGFDVTASDNDTSVLEVARETFRAFGQDVNVVEVDVTDLPPDLTGFDLIFSLGLIEHFDREVTVELVRQQRRAARVVMAVVPTAHTHHAAAVTDERLYDRAGWRQIFVDAGVGVSEAFVFGDLPTRTAAVARRALPPSAYRLVQDRLTFGMNICLFSEPSP
jgi:SAM-dependent methyltransferase